MKTTVHWLWTIASFLCLSVGDRVGFALQLWRIGWDLSQCFSINMRQARQCARSSPVLCGLWHVAVKVTTEDGKTYCSDLVYADDTTFFTESTADAITACQVSVWQHPRSTSGFHGKRSSCITLALVFGHQPHQSTAIESTASTASSIWEGSNPLITTVTCADINRRIGMASSVISFLSKTWMDRHLSIATKVRVYQALVLSVLAPVCSWNMDYACLWHQSVGIIPQEVPKTNTSQVASVHPGDEWWHNIDDCSSDHIKNYLTLQKCCLQPIARLQGDPAHKALWSHVDLMLGRLSSCEWKRLLAEPAAGGSIRSVTTMTTLHLQISSGVQPDMTIVEWHYGPRRLHAGILTMMTTRKNTSQKITSASYVMQTTQSYFSVATTSWFQLWNNDANNVRINCSCQWVEPRTRCNIIIPTFWVPDATNHNA